MMNMMILVYLALFNSLEIDSRLFGGDWGPHPLVPCWHQKWSRMKRVERVEKAQSVLVWYVPLFQPTLPWNYFNFTASVKYLSLLYFTLPYARY